MIEKIHIYDLDGTLFNTEHRLQYTADGGIDIVHWIAHRHLAYLDAWLPLAKQYREDIKNPKVFVIIATVRNMTILESMTVELLGWPDFMIRRNRQNMNWNNVTIKLHGLRKILNLKQFRGLETHFWEDSQVFIDGVSAAFPWIQCHLVPSNQGLYRNDNKG